MFIHILIHKWHYDDGRDGFSVIRTFADRFAAEEAKTTLCNNFIASCKSNEGDIPDYEELHSKDTTIIRSKSNPNNYESYCIILDKLDCTNMSDLYTIVQWPESQYLMDIEGWRNHCILINDGYGIEKFGSSAYFVEKEWYSENFEEWKYLS